MVAHQKEEDAKGNRTAGLNLFSSFSGHWYENPNFSRYWAHYNYVMSWCHQQRETLRTLQHQQIWPRNDAALRETTSKSFQQYSQRTGRKKRKKGSARKSRRNQTAVEEIPKDESDEDSYEMEITEEMMNFFSISKKHKEEKRKKEKAQNTDDTETEDDKYINIEAVNTQKGQANISSKAPRERPGARRTNEMKILYGRGAAMIHGMETAMQLTFDRNCDIRQPKMWPHMPLHIKFD
ncbi:gem-associated protein 8-like isoform X2 [Tubulanus polymorphus]